MTFDNFDYLMFLNPNICNIYYLQKELKHLFLEILVVYGISGHFELYQVFMYDFL